MQKSFSNLRNLRLISSLFVLIMLSITACQKEKLPEQVLPTEPSGLSSDRSSNTIVDIAISNPNFSTLVAAVVKTEQVALLSSAGLNATVFAPTNDAFAQLPAPFNNSDNIGAITDERTIQTLRQILRYHILGQRRSASQLTNGRYGTLRNSVVLNDNAIFVGRSIDNSVFINGTSKVVAADVNASNGIIHVIDKVLLPPSGDIYQVAASNSNFRALTAAIKVTGFLNILSSKMVDYTVFAPTDAAFAKLPAPLNNAQNIASITDPATIQLLRQVLQYHLLNGRVFSTDLRNGIQPSTVLPGKRLLITLTNGAQVKGDGNTDASNIIATNVLAFNGVIHGIDQVLLP